MSSGDSITLTAVQGREAPENIVIPRRLGPVRLIREVGHGGMGVVWLAHHDLLDRDVAVKFLLYTVTCQQDRDYTQFLNGARAAAAVAALPAHVTGAYSWPSCW